MAKTDTHNHPHTHTHDKVDSPFLTESKQVDIVIPWATIEPEYQKVLKSYQPHVKVDGFRKGKVPMKIVEESVSREKLYQTVAERVLAPAYDEALKKAKLEVIGEPEIHLEVMEHGQDWKFHALVSERPTVELKGYKTIVSKALKSVKTQPKDDQPMAEENKKTSKSDKKLKTETKEIPIEERQTDAVLRALQEKFAPKIPELLIKQEVMANLRELETQLSRANMKLDSYLNSVDKKIEDIQQEFATRALASWQIEFIFNAVASEEKITVVEADYAPFLTKEQKQLSDEQKQYLFPRLLQRKVIDFLLKL